MSEETAEDAASSCESEVDMVEAKMPARITPASRANITPCWESRAEIFTIMVSEFDPVSISSAPTLLMV